MRSFHEQELRGTKIAEVQLNSSRGQEVYVWNFRQRLYYLYYVAQIHVLMKKTHLPITFIVFYIGAFIALPSCNTRHIGSSATADSTDIIHAMQAVYKWHDHIKDKEAYVVIVKDSLQVGVDMAQLAATAGELKSTGYFSESFIDNYETIGKEVDNVLRHDTVKYYNEINFGFQDSDPWTFFQDDAGNYWDSFIIRDFRINADTASLKWTLRGISETDGYLVKFKRDKDGWKVAYMAGFDPAHI